MLLPSNATANTRIDPGRLFIWIAAALIIAGAVRYVEAPSFWLDEAFIAVSLRSPSREVIFGRLEYGQYFPRIYLAAIAALREVFGYHIWVLRLFPFLFFSIATIFWARLLAERTRPFWMLGVIGGALFIGSNFWLDQAIQLKQYTFDVSLAFVPFLLSDSFFKRSLADGNGKVRLAILAIPCFLSYTYPIALAARVTGWYLYRVRREGWGLQTSSALALTVPVLIGLVSIWATDYRFNFRDSATYSVYWNDCILRARIEQGVSGVAQLLAKFFWGWHGRMPLVTAGMVPLQVLGVYRVIRKWKSKEGSADKSSWGSRSLGSLVLLIGTIAASVLVSYPICAGRAVLFAQVHTQILALEGALFILSLSKKRTPGQVFLYLFVGVLLFHSLQGYIRYVRSEPSENLRPLLPLMKPEIANRVWVQSCSIAQVRSLPEPLPVEEVIFGTEMETPQQGQRSWIIWSHMGERHCQTQLEHLRSKALSWQVVHEGPGRGLALAQF